MSGRKAVAFFLMMLMAHLAHVFEEILGDFRAIGTIGNLGLFLIVNWVLIGFVVLILWLIMLRRRWAYILGIAYAAVMILNGLVHCTGFLVTSEYFGGFAGCFTGILLVALGPFLIYHLRREMPER